MKYELAKQLKDAGFPIRFVHELAALKYSDAEAVENIDGCGDEPEWFYTPTLSELIEACDTTLARLIHLRITRPEWRAEEHYHSQNHLAIGEGKTPEEAVARLWLALHPKTQQSSITFSLCRQK